jgi:hypothetical protein
MNDFLYRLAIAVKNTGVRWNIPPLIRLALVLWDAIEREII